MSQCSSDSEQDYETIELERRMAADDLEDESEVVAKGDIVLSTSLLDTMTVGMCKHIQSSSDCCKLHDANLLLTTTQVLTEQLMITTYGS